MDLALTIKSKQVNTVTLLVSQSLITKTIYCTVYIISSDAWLFWPFFTVSLAPERATFYGFRVEFTCSALEQLNYTWQLNGTTWNDATFPDFEASISQDGRTIQFQHIPTSANGTAINCYAIINNERPLDHRRVVKSNEGRIILAGWYIHNYYTFRGA